MMHNGIVKELITKDCLKFNEVEEKRWGTYQFSKAKQNLK